MPKAPGHGVTPADAKRIFELARQHGVDHVHPLLTCPKVTARAEYSLLRAAKRHGVNITPVGEGAARTESIRQAFRDMMDWALLPEGYPHKLTNDERRRIVEDMKKHGVEMVQRVLSGNRRPHDGEYHRALPE